MYVHAVVSLKIGTVLYIYYMKFSVSFFTLEFFDNIKHWQTNFELLIDTGMFIKRLFENLTNC